MAWFGIFTLDILGAALPSVPMPWDYTTKPLASTCVCYERNGKMTDNISAVNQDKYYQKVGQLVLGLSKQCSYVRVQCAESVIAKNMVLIKATTIRANQSFTVTETLRQDDLLAIDDVGLIVDNIEQRLRDEQKKVNGR